jgi:Reverse transcriptase (RNA-dependent DNA polymerase)
MDVLAVWIKKLNVNQILKPIYTGCRSFLLYADDTLIFIKPNAQQLSILKLTLDIFSTMSGLKVNLKKSKLLVTAIGSLKIVLQVIGRRHTGCTTKVGRGIPLN